MRPVQGGAGSKRSLLGCDPGAGHSVHRLHGTNEPLHGRIPAGGAPAPRSGAPPILAATTAPITDSTFNICSVSGKIYGDKGMGLAASFGPWHCRKPLA
jgi:hypothetical protein